MFAFCVVKESETDVADDGGTIPCEDFGKGRWKVEVAGFGGPIASQWVDEHGNHHTLYENGAHSVISHEIIEDELKHSEGI